MFNDYKFYPRILMAEFHLRIPEKMDIPNHNEISELKIVYNHLAESYMIYFITHNEMAFVAGTHAVSIVKHNKKFIPIDITRLLLMGYGIEMLFNLFNSSITLDGAIEMASEFNYLELNTFFMQAKMPSDLHELQEMMEANNEIKTILHTFDV